LENNQNPKKLNQFSNKYRNWTFWIVLILSFFIIYLLFNTGTKIDTISYTEFQQKVEAGDISKINVVGSNVRILLTDSDIDGEDFPAKADFKMTYINSEMLIAFIQEWNNSDEDASNDIIATYSFAEESFLESALPYLSFIVVLILGYIIIKSVMGTSGKNIGFGKTKAVMGENIKIRFDDVAGCDEEKAEIQEIVEFLKNPYKFTRLGARIPKGVLMVGPPGTGKTLLAKAIAGESRVPFFSISGSDFVEMFVGVGASRVRDLFEQAKRSAPCLIFIDEIDAVGRQRGAGLGGGNDEREQTLNQLLVQMDGFSGNEGIIVIAATNRPDVLDPALLRAGRFDRQIVVNRPDVTAREKILKVHSKNKPLDESVDFKIVAKNTVGFTGADLENLMNEAAILAVRKDRSQITMQDINDAVNKVLLGPQKRSKATTDEDNKITAYHEAGHTIVSYVLDKTTKVHEVSIIARGMALGYTSLRPENDSDSVSYTKLCNEIAMAAGGRIAEEVIFNDKFAGASNDIKVLSEQARRMVTEFGMSSKIGMIGFGGGGQVFIGRDYQSHINYSEKTAALIDEEVKRIVDENYARGKKAIEENIEKLHIMAEVLLEVETIETAEVDMIMSGKSKEEVINFVNEKQRMRKEKDDKDRKEREEKVKKMLFEMQLKAQRALVEAGAITEEQAVLKAKKYASETFNESESEKIINNMNTNKNLQSNLKQAIDKEMYLNETKIKTAESENAKTENAKSAKTKTKNARVDEKTKTVKAKAENLKADEKAENSKMDEKTEKEKVNEKTEFATADEKRVDIANENNVIDEEKEVNLLKTAEKSQTKNDKDAK